MSLNVVTFTCSGILNIVLILELLMIFFVARSNELYVFVVHNLVMSASENKSSPPSFV